MLVEKRLVSVAVVVVGLVAVLSVGESQKTTSTVRAWPSEKFVEEVLVTTQKTRQQTLPFHSHSTKKTRGGAKKATTTKTTSSPTSPSRHSDSGQGRRHAIGRQDRIRPNGTYEKAGSRIGSSVKEKIGNLVKDGIGNLVKDGIGNLVKGTVHKLKGLAKKKEAPQEERSNLILRKTVFRKISSKMVNKTSMSNSTALSHKSKIPFHVIPLEYPNLKEYSPYRPLRQPTTKKPPPKSGILKDKYNHFQKVGPSSSKVSKDDSIPVAVPFRVVHRKDPTDFTKLEEVVSKYYGPLGVAGSSSSSSPPTAKPRPFAFSHPIHEWIETDENSFEGVSPSPSLPQFPKLTWPYKNTSTISNLSTFSTPPAPPPPTAPAGDEERSTGTTSKWSKVPIVQVTPMSSNGYPPIVVSVSPPHPPPPPTGGPLSPPRHTNIWYKPTINYVGGQSPPRNPPGESQSPPVVLRVWNFVEKGAEPAGSSVQLVSEKEIPPWAVEGLGQVVPHAILNLDGIPQAVRDLVERAIRKEEALEESSEGTEEEREDSSGDGRIRGEGESRGKPAIQLNYVLWKKNKTSSTSASDLKKEDAASLDEYLHLLTPQKPPETKTSKKIINSPDSETWQLVHRLLTRLQESTESAENKPEAPSSPDNAKPPPTELNASLPANVDRSSLLANLAALLVLARHLNSSLPPPTASPPVPTPPQVPLNLTVHLLKELMAPPPTLTSTLSSQLKSKTLLLQGAVQKRVTKNSKKLKKKLKKFGWGLSKKKGGHKKKKFWFDLFYDVDLHALLKKKFLYLLALKYAPAFFVLAVALVPLAALLLPILLKILYFKKKPRYIRVPVPVPKPYPVPWEYYGGWGHPQSHPWGEEGPEESPGIYPGPPYSPEEEGPLESPTVVLESTSIPHTIRAGIPEFGDSVKKSGGPVGHAYELGFDLGSKLSKVTNIHDKEVLQILLQNKKDKIEKLLEKWKLLHNGIGVQPYAA